MTTHLDVVAANGIPFRVLLMGAGEASPNRHVKLAEHLPFVEVYDRRHGMFVADYYVEDILPGDAGLDLYGGEADWQIDAATMAQIRAWLS